MKSYLFLIVVLFINIITYIIYKSTKKYDFGFPMKDNEKEQIFGFVSGLLWGIAFTTLEYNPY